MYFLIRGVIVLNFRPVDSLFGSGKSNLFSCLVLRGNNTPTPAEKHLSPKAELNSQQRSCIKLLRTVLLSSDLLVTKGH